MTPVAERMTHSVTRSFDSLAYAKSMESVGFTRQQAEMLAEKQAELIDERLATKDDLEKFRLALEADMEKLRLSLKGEIEGVRGSLRETELRLQAQMKDLLVRLGGMIMALGGILIAIKYFG